MTLRSTMDIERALRWAYREELPKVGALNRCELDGRAGGEFMGERRELATTTQMLLEMPTNCFGVLQEVGAGRPPHPDAIVIGDAVSDLDGMVMGLPADWRPLAEMDDLSPEVSRLVQVAVDRVAGAVEGGARLFGMRPSFIVRRYALDDAAPDWRAKEPVVKLQSHSNGKPKWFVTRVRKSVGFGGREVSHEVEEDGYDARGKRPYPDAYRKIYLDPDPTPAIKARAEYELWHSCLDALVSDLASRLTSIRLLPSPRSARPWIDGETGPSIVPSLVDMAWP